MLISVRSLPAIVGALMLLSGAIQAHAEKCNLFKHHDCGCFTLVAAPNSTQADNVDVCKTCNDPTTNPFASCPGHSCSATLNADGTTTFTFCPGDSCTDNNSTDHFGLDGGGGGTFKILSGSWSCGSPTNATGNLGTGKISVCAVGTSAKSVKPGASRPLAGKAKENTSNSDSGRLVPVMQGQLLDSNSNIISVGTDNTQPPGPNPKYFLVYVRGTQTAPPNNPWDGSGVWVEQPYPNNEQPAFWFENDTTNDIWLNDVGYLQDQPELSIDLLNYANYPPSALNQVLCMDNIVLHPNDQVPIQLSCPSGPTTKQIGKLEPDGSQSSSSLSQTPLK